MPLMWPRRALVAAAALAVLGDAAVPGNGHRPRPKANATRKPQPRQPQPPPGQAAGGAGAAAGAGAVEDVPQPVLLGLYPGCGPRDGGTRVQLNALGVNRSAPLAVALRGIGPKGGRIMDPLVVPVERTADDELVFVTPNLTKSPGLGPGLLVSLTTPPQPRQRGGGHILAGPLFFRLLEPLAQLAPAWVSPCCDFKLSGGQVVVLSGSGSGAPSHHAVVRFRGLDHEVDVDGELVEGEWGVATVAESAPEHAWHVYAVTPPWPSAEEEVALEVSWNRQQFSAFGSPLAYREERSFFGDVVQGISEEHLLDGKSKAAAGGAGAGGGGDVTFERVTVVEGPEGGGPPGGPPDLSGALILDQQGDAFILARSNDLTHLAEDLRLIHDLFVLTCAATAGGALAALVRAPSIIGFLVGGVVVGPGGLDWVVELVQIESVAELGVCLLLFCIGLELSVEELRLNVRAAFAGLLSMGLLCGTIVLLAIFLTRTPLFEAMCIGVFASLASTPVSLRALPRAVASAEGTLPAEPNGEAGQLLAILVTQDIVLAGLLAAMPVIFRPPVGDPAARAHGAHMPATERQAPMSPMPASAHWHRLVHPVMAAAPLLCLLCRRRCRDRLRRVMVRARLLLRGKLLRMHAESFTLLALAYAFAISWLTDTCGLSVELGAFLAGLALSSFSGEVGQRTEQLVGGLKDTFVAWFFASIGLVVNPRFLLDNLRAILSVVTFIFVLKLATGFLPLWLLSTRSERTPALTALRASWILAHVSEFGFVLAAKGSTWGVLSRHVYLLLVGANALSLCLAPWLFRMRDCLLPVYCWGPTTVAASEEGGRSPRVCSDASPTPILRPSSPATASMSTPRSVQADVGEKACPEATRFGRPYSEDEEEEDVESRVSSGPDAMAAAEAVRGAAERAGHLYP